MCVAIVGAGDRIGGDAAGVVIDVGGDDAGAHDGEQQCQPDAQPLKRCCHVAAPVEVMGVFSGQCGSNLCYVP